MLGEWETLAGDGDVVIRGEQGDQAENQAHEGLKDPRRIEAQPAELR